MNKKVDVISKKAYNSRVKRKRFEQNNIGEKGL